MCYLGLRCVCYLGLRCVCYLSLRCVLPGSQVCVTWVSGRMCLNAGLELKKEESGDVTTRGSGRVELLRSHPVTLVSSVRSTTVSTATNRFHGNHIVRSWPMNGARSKRSVKDMPPLATRSNLHK